jgi:hypothetical protein
MKNKKRMGSMKDMKRMGSMKNMRIWKRWNKGKGKGQNMSKS